MSLLVNIIAKDNTFNISEIEKEIQYPHNSLFGFESWRHELWGHEIMQLINCKMLYSLKSEDVYVYDSDIQKLKIELNQVLTNLDRISRATTIDKKAIQFRVFNALETIKIAEKYSEYVGIVLW